MLRDCETCVVNPGRTFCALDAGINSLTQAKDAGVDLGQPLHWATREFRQEMEDAGCLRANPFEDRKPKALESSSVPTDTGFCPACLDKATINGTKPSCDYLDGISALQSQMEAGELPFNEMGTAMDILTKNKVLEVCPRATITLKSIMAK
jgi:hypothetical protein